ncbi:MAG TPA: TolC family protein [Flavisolibacter sp.]|nr:TolC family protein [Flavisolibacter sp.]
MMLSIKKIGLLGLLIWPMQLLAQKPEVLSLDTILQRLEQNNPILQTYGLKAQSYQYKAKAATSWMAPMIGAGTYMTPYPGTKIMDPRDKGSLMFEVEQDIPNPAKLKAQKQYIESLGEVEKASHGVTFNELKAQAKSLYFNWLIAQQRIQILKESDKIMQTMKKIEQIRYPYNQSQLGGVYQATAKIEENQNMIRMQEGDIERSRALLNALMNLPGNQSFEIDSTFQPGFIPAANLDTAQLASSRKDIFRMEQSIRAMQLNIASMKTQSKPDFKIRLDHMSPLDKMMPNAYSLMGMVSIPIAPWSSKMYKNEVKAMQYEVLAMEKKIIPALRKSMEVNFLSYQENKLELRVVIDSWEALLMMENNLLDEKGKLYQMIVDYEKEIYR